MAARPFIAGGMLAAGAAAGYVPLPYYRRRVFCEEPQDMVQKVLGTLSAGGTRFQVPDWLTVEAMKPIGGGLSFGGVSGFCAGMACKKVGRAAAAGLGGVYVVFQTAAYFDYITVNWKKVESDVMSRLDTNGDGIVDEKDMGNWLNQALHVLAMDEQEGAATKNTAAAGFAAAFLYGFKKG